MLIFPKSLAGVTLIEAMIAITILGVLLVVGLPESFKWIQNTKIRSAAESVSNGLQLARVEAVRRNVQVEFVLTNNDPVAANMPTLAPSTSGPFWVVRKLDSTGVYDPADPKAPWFIQGGGNEVSTGSVVVSTNPADANVVFDGLGRTDLAAGALTVQVTNPKGGACVAASGPMRCLNIVVQPGGQIRMCDPAITTAGDTRKC